MLRRKVEKDWEEEALPKRKIKDLKEGRDQVGCNSGGGGWKQCNSVVFSRFSFFSFLTLTSQRREQRDAKRNDRPLNMNHELYKF